MAGGTTGFLGQLGSFFKELAGAEDGVHIRIWQELKPWFGNLTQNAGRKWLPRLAAGMMCEVPIMRRGQPVAACDHIGVAACDVCHRGVCLEHSRIDQLGDAICYLCVADAMEAVPPLRRERARRGGEQAPPPREPRAQRQQQQQQPPPGKQPPSPEQISGALKVLGLKPSATWDDVRAAHRKLSGQHHPDRKKTPRDKRNANARYLEVQAAYDLLKKVYPDA